MAAPWLLSHTPARGYPCVLIDRASSNTPPGGAEHSPPVDARSTRADRASSPSSDRQDPAANAFYKPVSSPDTEVWEKFRHEEESTASVTPDPEERKRGDQPRPECCLPLT